jgi:hypothetical protein
VRVSSGDKVPGLLSAHVLAYHDVSQLTVLLLLWRHDSIKYPEML